MGKELPVERIIGIYKDWLVTKFQAYSATEDRVEITMVIEKR